jgi:hypothetical protein
MGYGAPMGFGGLLVPPHITPFVTQMMSQMSHMRQLMQMGHAAVPQHLRLGLVDRDFNDEDYEALLQLDESNVSRGAERWQIERLPTRRLVEDGEQCCVCLENMLAGSEVRCLPCLHNFHTECIDSWLAVNRSCPIDKVAIDSPNEHIE